MNVGFVTIGQSPRRDVLDDILPIINYNLKVEECGALDYLNYDEILNLKPENANDYILISRLRDGREVTLSKKKIIDRMQDCINKLEKNNEIIVLLCTGEFPELKSNNLLIEPSLLLYNIVKSIIQPETTLSILIPSSSQINEIKQKWNFIKNLNIYPISPYQSSEKDYIKLSKKINKNTNLLVLDCIGYSIKIRKLMSEYLKKPVILPRLIIADLIKELTF